MANDFFKTKQTTTNTYVYVHAQQGSDITGDGSIGRPYASLLKAHSAYPSRTKLLRGTLTENPSADMTVQGDEMWQTILFTTIISARTALNNISLPANYNLTGGTVLNNSIATLKDSSATNGYTGSIIKTMVKKGGTERLIQSTCVTMQAVIDNFSAVTVRNSIIINMYATAVPSRDTVAYTVFSSRCVFYWGNNGVTPVPAPAWGNDPVENMRMLKRAIDPSWVEFGANTPLDDIFGTVNIAGQKFETCRIVLEEKDGGTLPDMFNSYEADGITPKDFYLNADPRNIALHASETGSYVGALPPAQGTHTGTDAVNVSASGADDGDGVLLVTDGTDITNNTDPATYGGQVWNRIVSPVAELYAGSSFLGVANFVFMPGRAFGMYCGKKQTLYGAELLPSGGTFAVAPDTRYVVRDASPDGTPAADTGVTVTSGTDSRQYVKNAVFDTPADISGITVAAVSDSVRLVPLLHEPYESFEVRPYDSLTAPSQFPRFSCPVNTAVKMAYHKTGADAGNPVLISEVAGNGIDPYFQGYAVTNADDAYAALIADTVNYEARDVFLRYFAIELNVHYDSNLSEI